VLNLFVIMPSSTHSLGQLIFHARKQKKLSQRKLAELLQCNFTYISKIERGTCGYPPGERLLQDLITILELDEMDAFQASGKFHPTVEQQLLELWKTHGKNLLPIIETGLEHYQVNQLPSPLSTLLPSSGSE
jgi:HTH-type transcriptional regulator, competence development regulator